MSDAASEASAPLRALVVEDDAMLRQTLTGMLESLGLTCDSAADGREGLSRMRSQQYDVTLTDMRMPRMNGFEMVTKACEQLERPPVFVVLSGYHDYSEEELRAAGVSLVLYKPLRLSTLHDRLAEVIPLGAQART